MTDHPPSFIARVLAAYGLEQVTEDALRLREARLAHGLTQAQAAEALGITAAHLCHMERGRVPVTAAFLERAS